MGKKLREGPVKGWKCFKRDLTCRGMLFAVGGTYQHSGEVKLCASGFHFHENGHEIFKYYANSVRDTRVCEVVGYGVISEGDKSACARIEIGRELGFLEICLLNGDGYGDGYGYGYGYGDGNGNGNGYGYGNGNGYGYGYGDGYGYGYDGNGNGKYEIPGFLTFVSEEIAP